MAREETLLLRSNMNKRPMSWSRDGKFLLYSTSPSVTFADEDLWVLAMQGDPTPYPFLKTPFNESNARFSPDGRFVAYYSDETGRNEVYVREFSAPGGSPGAGGKWLVSKDSGINPDWREDGKELVYRGREPKIMSVSVDTAKTFQAGEPQQLFQAPEAFGGIFKTNDMKRFLVTIPVKRKVPRSVHGVAELDFGSEAVTDLRTCRPNG